MKDWTGNSASTLTTIGAHNFSTHDREPHDYYATHPDATKALLKVETFSPTIWEPACGEGHLSSVLKKAGYKVRESDIIDRMGNEVLDFLTVPKIEQPCDIVTNPPYRYSLEFALQALELVREGGKVAMLLRLQWLEGITRRERLYDTQPPHTVYVFSRRVKCAMNGDFESVRGSATAYCWMVWVKGYKGNTILQWI